MAEHVMKGMSVRVEEVDRYRKGEKGVNVIPCLLNHRLVHDGKGWTCLHISQPPQRLHAFVIITRQTLDVIVNNPAMILSKTTIKDQGHSATTSECYHAAPADWRPWILHRGARSTRWQVIHTEANVMRRQWVLTLHDRTTHLDQSHDLCMRKDVKWELHWQALC